MKTRSEVITSCRYIDSYRICVWQKLQFLQWLHCFACFFQSVVENKNLELRVKVRAGPDVKVTWFQNGKEMVQSPRVKVSKVKDVHTLMLVQVTQTMTGSYSVVASNRHGKVEHVAQITVTGWPWVVVVGFVACFSLWKAFTSLPIHTINYWVLHCASATPNSRLCISFSEQHYISWAHLANWLNLNLL